MPQLVSNTPSAAAATRALPAHTARTAAWRAARSAPEEATAGSFRGFCSLSHPCSCSPCDPRRHLRCALDYAAFRRWRRSYRRARAILDSVRNAIPQSVLDAYASFKSRHLDVIVATVVDFFNTASLTNTEDAIKNRLQPVFYFAIF
ncbi:MAG: hypothetical protein R2881_01495 [Eubacteriales bacterium]